jgi:hypothetical protein
VTDLQLPNHGELLAESVLVKRLEINDVREPAVDSSAGLRGKP